jgi:hypothetical protein
MSLESKYNLDQIMHADQSRMTTSTIRSSRQQAIHISLLRKIVLRLSKPIPRLFLCFSFWTPLAPTGGSEEASFRSTGVGIRQPGTSRPRYAVGWATSQTERGEGHSHAPGNESVPNEAQGQSRRAKRNDQRGMRESGPQ